MLGKGKIIGIFIGLFLAIGGLTYYIVNNQKPTQVQNNEFGTENKEKEVSKKEGTSANYDKKEIFIQMHKMANTLIIARDGQVWGEIQIDKENIADMEVMVNSNNNLDKKEKERILETLDAWKKGDFSDGVDQHNYFWDKLGGNIGRAKDLKSEYKK